MSEPSPDDDIHATFSLGVRARHALRVLGLKTYAEVADVGLHRLLSVRHCGKTTVGEIRRALASRGLRFSDEERVTAEDMETRSRQIARARDLVMKVLVAVDARIRLSTLDSAYDAAFVALVEEERLARLGSGDA